MNDATRYYYEDAQKYQAVVKKWKSVVDEHNRLKEKIGVAYTVANNLSTPVSDEMQKVIDLCIKDLPKLDSADIVETTFSDAFHK